MKYFFLGIIAFLFSVSAFSQVRDTTAFGPSKAHIHPTQLVGKLGPSAIPVDSLVKQGAWLIVNNVLIKDEKRIMTFFVRYKEYFKSGSFYSKEKSEKKWGLNNNVGIFYFKIKKININLD